MKPTQDFQGRENVLDDPIMMDTGLFTCVRIHRTYNTESEPQYKRWTIRA